MSFHLLEHIPTTDLPPGVEAWTVLDPDPDISYLEQPEFSDRLDAYRRDVFSFVGVVLRRRCPTCTQWEDFGGTVWGVESDSGVDYFRNLAKELADEA